MSLKRPAAGGESCKAGFFLVFFLQFPNQGFLKKSNLKAEADGLLAGHSGYALETTTGMKFYTETVESEREFMKGCTTAGVFLCELFLFSVSERRTMITINGMAAELEENVTVADYLEQNRYQTNRIAVELNGTILPKSLYTSTVLHAGDVLEIVSFVGGG